MNQPMPNILVVEDDRETRTLIAKYLRTNSCNVTTASDGREMARRLAREEGLLVGTSSGLNIAAALQIARELGSGKVVATVAVDSGLKYLAGDLFETGHAIRS